MTRVWGPALVEGTPSGAWSGAWQGPLRRWGAGLAAGSGALVVVGWALGWRGVDLPAQIYRVQQFRDHGVTLWDSQWYSGHWMLDYSVIYPAVAGVVGMELLAVLSALAATMAFDRLVVGHFGPRARVATAIFAVSVVVETSIGQLPFFTGEAFALCSVWAMTARRRRPVLAGALAGVLAVAATLTSPLAGAFLALVVLAWFLVTLVEQGRTSAEPRLLGEGEGLGEPGEAAAVALRPDLATVSRRIRRSLPARRWRQMLLGWRPGRVPWGLAAVCALALAPVGVTAVLFPGAGPMPYPATDWMWDAAVAVILWLLAPGRPIVVRAAISLYFLATVLSVLVPTEVGGNVGRMEDVLALPLAAAFCLVPRAELGGLSWFAWLVRRLPGRPATRLGTEPALTARLALALVTVPLIASQWIPATSALTTSGAQVWTTRAYYTPLVSWLRQADQPPGAPVPVARIELVPTEDHWETDYVAPVLPLARGWERQLDVVDAPLFYHRAPLTPKTYRAWLVSNGVRYVALASAPLDLAGVAEAKLLDKGVAGLRPVWHNRDWRVYEVTAPAGQPSPQIVTGPGRLTADDGGHVAIEALAAGRILVRVRAAAHWFVAAGAARLAPAAGGWTSVVASHPGRIRLQARL